MSDCDNDDDTSGVGLGGDSGSGITSGKNFNKFENIPVRVSGENPPSPIKSFSSAGLRPLLLKNISKSGYKVPTPVQKCCLPIIMSGRDLMSCAQTRSGKTAAFLLPILHKLMETQADNHAGEMVQAPQCVVITPTRELAMQIQDEAQKFSMGSTMKCFVAYGGTSVGYQLTQLQKGCNILICTPGRMMDFVDKRKVTFENLKYLVLDEADRMLDMDMGFMKDIERCIAASTMPPKGERQTLMFSTEFPDEIQLSAQKFLTLSYLFVTVGVVEVACADVVQEFQEVTKMADKNASQIGSKTELGLLEEDAEFEEFPQDDWDARKEDSGDGQMWDDSWDNDNVDNEFANQLRVELESKGYLATNKQ